MSDVTIADVTIVSGGQTGVDRAALDVAIAAGVPHEGWCPKGRRAEDGPISPDYHLRETPSADYTQRTEWNVRDTDATVVFSIFETVSGGTALTLELAARLGRPCLHLASERIGIEAAADQLRAFVAHYHVTALNVAGSRGSQVPGAAQFARAVLTAALSGNSHRE